MIGRELYAVLGVAETATQDEIRRAYRRRAKVLHPDKGGDPDDFDRLTRAHDTLSDPERRRRYDQMGDVHERAEEPPEDTKLMVILSQIIQNVVCGGEGQPEPDLASTDIVRVIRQNMHQMEGRLIQMMGVTERRISRNRELTRRLRRKRRRGEDLLRMVLRGQRTELRRVLEKQREDLAIHRRVIRVFDSYDYAHDIVAQATQTWTFVATR